MKRHTHSLFLATGTLLLGLSASAQEDFTGKVVGVSDGDTIKVLRLGQQVKVRLSGIDCPEKRQPFGKRAKRFTSDLVFAKTVTVKVQDIDRYKRIVGEVILKDGTSLNQELVRAGLAWWYQRYAPDDKQLERLEQLARKNKHGLWADPDPVPPWEFRKKRRKR
ncbi:thermonuclease family protein [Myxococcota bacterium]